MALTVDDLITREEIRDTLNAYSYGLDQREWDLFDRAFTDDATFTAPDEGIDNLPAQELKEMLKKNNDETRLSGQHLLHNTFFQIDGDTAHTVTEAEWITLQTTDKPDIVYEVRAGGMYVDDLVKVDGEWRIQKRVLITKNKSTRGVNYTPERIENIRTHSLNAKHYK